jgi:hypothetical protein
MLSNNMMDNAFLSMLSSLATFSKESSGLLFHFTLGMKILDD